jgi:SAM-dependent methyltransferase
MEVYGGALREVAPPDSQWIGVDAAEGPGVDRVLVEPYRLPFVDDSVDVVVSSSTFEHAEFFWLLFLEMARILKPGGFLYINSPSNGPVHRHPVDCWRFYPDAGDALTRWAARNFYFLELLESSIGELDGESEWLDWVGVWRKGLTE